MANRLGGRWILKAWRVPSRATISQGTRSPTGGPVMEGPFSVAVLSSDQKLYRVSCTVRAYLRASGT